MTAKSKGMTSSFQSDTVWGNSHGRDVRLRVCSENDADARHSSTSQAHEGERRGGCD